VSKHGLSQGAANPKRSKTTLRKQHVTLKVTTHTCTQRKPKAQPKLLSEINVP